MEGPEIKFAEAVIDNGKYGKRIIRFETGRLAQQAQGAVAAYLDEETMLLSATSASKQPREGFDFFPLTVDVEERSYAAGKIPGSFFRREGRPSTEAILVCRLIDRPLRPSFVDGLGNAPTMDTNGGGMSGGRRCRRRGPAGSGVWIPDRDGRAWMRGRSKRGERGGRRGCDALVNGRGG